MPSKSVSQAEALLSPAMDARGDAETPDFDDPALDARRARWTAALTGAVLALAGVAAAALRASGSAPVLVPAAYAVGAALCALASVLGTSTSSIGATEEAYTRLTPAGEFPEDLRYQAVHTPHSTGEFLQRVLQAVKKVRRGHQKCLLGGSVHQGEITLEIK